MEIVYQLKEADLIALAKFQIEKSGFVKMMTRRRRMLYTIGFGVLAVGTWLISGNSLFVYASVFLAIFALVASPFASRWIANRNIPRVVRSRLGRNSLGSKTLSASSDGLLYRSIESQSEIQWTLVDDIAETENHVFIAVDSSYSIVIPKSELDTDNLGRFLAEARSKATAVDA